MDTTKIFNQIEKDILLRIDCFDNLLSEGKIYLGEQKLYKNKILEKIEDVTSWTKENAKLQCMQNNNIEIWDNKKIAFYITYINQKYGKNYLNQFKN